MNKTFPASNELRRFGLLVGGIIVGLFGLALPLLRVLRGREAAVPVWAFVAGLALIVLAFAAPAALNVPYRIWMRAGHALGWINSRLILGILFFIVVVPVGFFKKLLTRGHARSDIKAGSFRQPCHPKDPKTMERPF